VVLLLPIITLIKPESTGVLTVLSVKSGALAVKHVILAPLFSLDALNVDQLLVNNVTLDSN